VKKFLTWVACILLGHLSPKDNLDHFTGDCARCGLDVRPSWMVELEHLDRLEAMAIRALERERKRT
jgi:hypothetical protein